MMGKTLVDINEGLLAQARDILGTNTKKDTVNGALLEIVRQHTASRFLERARNGVFGPAPTHAEVTRPC
jgi:Arc/MetJ family transcription regulator